MTEPAEPALFRREGAIRAVLFDFGGTLDADGVAWKERFFRIAGEEGTGLSQEEFDRAFYAADDALVGRLSRSAPLEETVGRLAEGLTLGLSLPGGSAPRIAARFLAGARPSLSQSAALLERLARRYRLGVVSNFYGNLAAVCEGAGLARHLSVALDSEVAGFRKPDPRIFGEALAAIGVEPPAALFVGDSPERDMAGARGVGMPHVWLTPGGNGAARACCPGDLVIRRLNELAEILP